MAKRPKKDTKTVSKKEFDMDNFLEENNMSGGVDTKELTWIPLSKAWHDALKIPGFPRGYVSLIRGFSNTGKSTAFYEAIRGAQQIGDIPVIIETEGNWQDDHAKSVGVEYEQYTDQATGEAKERPKNAIFINNSGLLARYQNYDYKEGKKKTKPTRHSPVIEDVIHFMSELLDLQAEGKIQKNLCFLWDSIGTLDCYKSITSSVGNNMWNAGAMGQFQNIVNYRIPSSREVNSEYTNTFICVQKIWLDSMNGMVIKHRGGEFMFFNSRLIVHLGGIIAHGTKKLKATALGQDFQYGVQTKIRCEKNHVTNIVRMGDICSTAHGYVNPKDLDDYKKEQRNYIHDALNVEYSQEIEFYEEDGELSTDDKTEE